ncbi:hypothetical protein BDU57DRAFT_537068 [Ampelomyces quisqualis]|uniref:USP domain-containing protein n=1 Tax=Ampelomyces quisqualis TaxID=50730 RepID=A0A6A5QNQ5_AMPQU|nr:hypothetical protein BDU57DRAFT_537068 [Ampelomyces quisqualis]
MNARDDDYLAHPVAADDTAITATGPTSPPRRDPVEDADPSFTRKRPRLGSGSNSIRALSADTESSATPAASPREPQVEMTIRAHPPSSPVPVPVPAAAARRHDANGLSADPQTISPILIATAEDESGSPPVMLIEEDDAPGLDDSVQIDADDHFQQFPWVLRGDYMSTVRELPKFIQSSGPIDVDLLPQLSDWLDGLPDPSVDDYGFYISKASFWDDFGTVASKVLSRRYQWTTALNGGPSTEQTRYPFGDHIADDVEMDRVFDRFLGAYLRICSILLFVDAEILSSQAEETIYHEPLLTQRHIRSLHNIIRYEKSPIFHVLHKEYDVDLRELNTELHRKFLRARGAQNLLELMDAAFHRVPPSMQNNYASYTSQILSSLGWTVFELPGANTFIDRSAIHRGILSFFCKYSGDISDPSIPIDAAVARDLITYLSTLIHELCQWDDDIAAELVEQFLDFGDPDSPAALSAPHSRTTSKFDYRRDPACFPALAANAWKFKVLRRYIIKGNMALRVMSIATMDTALVEIWREISNIDPSCKHPVMQYLADFLIQGQVVDYIVSVDSHPQLISRSGNIAGFLVIAHRWSDDQADAIWKTVFSSPDPRVVTATMTMLRSIIHLMTASDRLYIVKKLFHLPINRYTLDILRFFRTLTMSLTVNNNVMNLRTIDYSGRGPTSRPWNVCIRIVQSTAPSRITDKTTVDLHVEAFDQLNFLADAIMHAERHTIYRECAQQIADQSDGATGSYRILCLLSQYSYVDDTLFFRENQDLLRSVLNEIPSFVEKEGELGPCVYQTQALHYRLDFLRLAITHHAMVVPTDLYQDLWDHIIGSKALSNEARDLAWTFMLQSIKTRPGNEFCKQLVSLYLPSFAAQFYTSGFFEFVASYRFPITRSAIQTDQGDEMLLQIPGASLLWSILLSSPTGTIEDRSARLLATRYVKIIEEDGVRLPEVEKAHIALVEQCMQALRAAIEAQPQQFRAAKPTDVPERANTRHSSQAHVERILLFQKFLLECVRQRPEFNRGQRVDSKVDAMDADVPSGDAIVVRYQCGNDRHVVTMASNHTIDDLYRRLCHATGFTKINLFARGQRLKVFEEATHKLSEVDLGGQVIVQRAEGADVTRPLPESVAGSSIFETAIVKHFDELFGWMDSASITSQLLFEFLTSFPARSTFADGVTRGEASTEDLFPPGKGFQAQYAALALQTRLREQIRNSALNEVFLINAIQHFDKALLDTQLLSEAFDAPQDLKLAAVLVNVLLEFLRERPDPETSAGYFSNCALFVDRLVKIVTVAIQASNSATIAQDAYATILEASLHSRAIWDAFTHHPDLHRIHQELLLVHPDQSIRHQIARKIASICGGDLPSTCPITKGETASQFWSVISVVVPLAGQYAGQSQQLFDIAEHVFRANDEYERSEDYLRALLKRWSALLLNHQHQEYPGREQIDHVVLGLTKLLLYCILSIKSFKKPVNAGSLMKEVFRKYIFVESARTDSASTKHSRLPILESHTRQELYDLMLGLAEDRSTYDLLLQLAGEVENEDIGPVLSTHLVDRSLEIRSTTGYVGLYNPRAICYMNSLLTQLFMNLNFRKFMLSLDVKDASGSQKLLFETQRLFAQMQNSYRKSTDPRNFAACVNSLDKIPIDITVQMDADEFYNLLFDQWEAQLLQQEHKQQFRSFYGGHTLNQIKSKECEHVSERVEPFFAVQCDIAGKANLQESLQAYVQGDVMEGDNKYKCESCDGKFVDAVKRTCLKEAPDNLIFHLKRFEFDLNDFSRRKIYDHFAFPESLDISPYKADHLADPTTSCAEDLFDLVGVLVHTGTCENGHYYSYIRQRPSSTQTTWVEFNDSEVVPFDPAEIAERTFGGFADGDGYNRPIKQFSAYMLFYQRRAAVDEDQRRQSTISTACTPQVNIPKLFEEETNIQNGQFVREYALFDPVHAKFVRQLHGVCRKINHGTCSEDHGQEMNALHIILAHLGHIAWRQQNSEIFLDLLLQLRRSMLSCATCCAIALQWLATDDHALTNIILKCTHPRIRSQARSLIVDSLKTLRQQDPIMYGMDLTDSDMEVDSITFKEGMFSVLVRRFRKTADESYESTRGWEDFYLMLTQLSEIGHLETAELLNHGLLFFCLRLFCMHACDKYQRDLSEFAKIMEKRRGCFNRMIGFVWKLLSQMDPNLPTIVDSQTPDRLATLDLEQTKFPLVRKEATALTWWSDEVKQIAVLDKILEVFDNSKVEHFYPGEIVKWMLAFSNESVQVNISRTVLEGLQLDPPYIDAYVYAALSYCEACPRGENITRVINGVTKLIASPNRAAEDRLPSGEAVLTFYSGLLKAQKENSLLKRHPHAFHQALMLRSRTYAIPLLCHYNEQVRKASFSFFQQLYSNDDAYLPETIDAKYNSARDLLVDLMHKFSYERDVGQQRSFVVPLVDTCRVLVQQLYILAQSQEPDVQEFQGVNDAALICQFQHEVEARMRTWLHDTGTPNSQGEAFDQSDYASESDDAHDLLDN